MDALLHRLSEDPALLAQAIGLALAGGTLGAALVLFVRVRAFARRARRATAEIVNIGIRPGRLGNRAHFVQTVRFRDFRQREHTVEGVPLRLLERRGREIGDEIEVLYRADDPHDVRSGNGLVLHAAPLLMLLVSLLLLGQALAARGG